MQIRRARERGHFENEWLNSYHTFSFADYFDRRHMNFHALRVINEDVVQPAAGFPTHGHRDMEIITYVVEGAVAHKDSMGNAEQIQAGEVQVMSAGQGVMHSEFNPDAKKPLKLLQIWILPEKGGLPPSYQQKEFSRELKLNRFCLIASPDELHGSLKIHQDARLSAAILEAGKNLQLTLTPARAYWLQIVRGSLEVNGVRLESGDALAVNGGEGAGESGDLNFISTTESELLLFDLAKQ